MIRTIVVFNEFSDVSVVENIGGIIVDNLSKMDKLLIADIPEEKISDLRNNAKIKSIQVDSELIVEHATSNSDPHLHMDGNSYIQLPSMTYTAIELDVIIDKTTNNTASRYLFDNRSTGIAYFYSNSSNLEVFYNCTVYINGVLHTDTSGGPHYSIIPDGQRTTIKVVLPSAVTSTSLLFTRSGLGYYAYGDIYSIKVYNSSNIIAQYDMSTGSLNDTTGSGNNATLVGGQWVGLQVATVTKESFSKYEGGLHWGLVALRAKDYWDRGLTGKGLSVGIMDVGFYHHNYLIDDYVTGVDYSATNNYLTAGNSGLMHGLEVSSQIDSDIIYTNSGFHSGLCRGIKFYAIKTYDGSYPTNSQIVSALNWAMQNNIKILNFSSIVYLNQDPSGYGGTFSAIDTFINNDGIIFMSAGNYREEVTSSTSINGYSSITLVGGIDNTYKRWDDGNTGSNYGQNLSFMTVYGDLMYKTNTKGTLTDEVGVGRGTSYSAPLATGIFALYKEAYPSKTNHEVLQIMKDSAKKIDGRTSWDMYYGNGLLQPNDYILSMPRIMRDNGLRFKGAGDYINCGHNPSLDISNNLSIILEFSQDYGGDGYLIAKIDPTKTNEGAFYGIRLGHNNQTGSRIYVYYNTGGTFTNANYPISLSDTKKYRLAVVYNYPNILVYVNGTLYTTLSMNGTMSASTASTGTPNLFIGSSTKSGERSFNGIIYEAKIYNSSLSSSDIANDYNGNKIDGAILNYKFNGTETTTIDDLSSYGNNGTIFGAKPNIRRNI